MAKTKLPPAPPENANRFVIDKDGNRIPVAETDDIAAAARRAKGLAPAPETQPKET